MGKKGGKKPKVEPAETVEEAQRRFIKAHFRVLVKNAGWGFGPRRRAVWPQPPETAPSHQEYKARCDAAPGSCVPLERPLG